ncbi:hypothetical protein EKH57_01305 [Halorubrum sp. BOL3-1]|uniref:HEAT repeat domain-containing protein n=1 Tax=Halorubrum sp. BOL3-1 TaxID=2497325 RepID=UPI0010052343|nr:HEAT repeat domain-containing protein [Halorubrum sp. BOL3-1]QAU11515.1 hypothetical protein EKH57_01305 [Halorubrum sp. BOL3-1]
MSDDGDSRSTLDRVRAKKREVSPETGYQLVEWDLMKPPAEQIMKRSQRWLTLSDVSVPQQTEFTDWSVFDRYTNEYVRSAFQDLPEEPEPESIPDALQAIETGDEWEKRIALVRLKRIAERHPDACESVVPRLSKILPESDLAVQAEVTGIFSVLAEESPALVTPALDVLSDFLTPDTDDHVLKNALSAIKEIAEEDASAVTDVVPRCEVLLQDETRETIRVLLILERVADEHPETVLPTVPTLIEYTTDVSNGNRVGALSVLGRVSKAYPNVATDVIPTAHELLSTDDDQLRANAAGILADQAEEYPEEVRPTVPDVIELLGDEDEYVRYNATSILARIAEHYPNVVEPATETLLASLDEDRAAARENACWALGRLTATTAEDALRARAEHDSNERVRNVASWALDEINDG